MDHVYHNSLICKAVGYVKINRMECFLISNAITHERFPLLILS